jgi:hypothetical protein
MKYVWRALGWIVAVAVALPLIPLAMSLCAGIYWVAVSSDRGERQRSLGAAGGLISVVVSLAGIGLTIGLVRLGFWLFGGH